MIKRLFFLSGIIAFVLACCTMWFWYLPHAQVNVPGQDPEVVSIDTVSVEMNKVSE